MNYKKYEFPTKELLEEKVNELQETKDQVIVLNKLVIESEISDQNHVIKEAVLSEGWCADVVWHKEDDSTWKEYEINPKNPKHKIFE